MHPTSVRWMNRRKNCETDFCRESIWVKDYFIILFLIAQWNFDVNQQGSAWKLSPTDLLPFEEGFLSARDAGCVGASHQQQHTRRTASTPQPVSVWFDIRWSVFESPMLNKGSIIPALAVAKATNIFKRLHAKGTLKPEEQVPIQIGDRISLFNTSAGGYLHSEGFIGSFVKRNV